MSARKPADPPPGALLLTLYVAGDNAFSRRAQANLEAILMDADLTTKVQIIDVLKQPELTMRNRIFVTPALVFSSNSGPESLIVGDFSETDHIARMLRNASDGI